MAARTNQVLLEARGLSKSYDEDQHLVLDDINLQIRSGEFVALLGPSGSGKSTLLRIITGLIPPTSGQVLYAGKPVSGPNPHASMIFQSFALYPWLTVTENVELGLKAKGVHLEERTARARKLIELIGLDGFEDAYPKELSGGMRQRVGFARALAVEPELLTMDEAFSALDFLTAENLRTELLELWTEGKMPLKSILMVTHGIEEAVFMADRIIVLSRNPARVAADLNVPLPQPRNRKSPEFQAYVDRLYKIVTGEHVDDEEELEVSSVDLTPGAPAVPEPRPRRLHRLPHAGVNVMAGLLELVEERGGRDDLYHLGQELLLEVDDLLPVTEAAELLDFAHVEEGDLILTELGKTYVECSTAKRKALFYRRIRELPMFVLLTNLLRRKRDRTVRKEFLLELLAEHFPEEEAERQLRTAVQWGRYAELFHYDNTSEELYVDEGDRADEVAAEAAENE